MSYGRIILACLALAACVATPDVPSTGQQPPDGKGDDPDLCFGQPCDPGGGDGDGDTDSDSDGDSDVDPSCEPRGCDGACGVIEDGCGGTISCGPCGCEATTCAEEGAVCGTIDDGCGNQLDCSTEACTGACVDNQCVCEGDDLEPNDDDTAAIELGSLSDADGAEVEQVDMNLHSQDDIDWYTVDVVDDWSWGGNPVLHVQVSSGEGGDLEVTAYYFCNVGPDYYHTCEHSSLYSDDFGAGCQGSSQLSLQTECDWSDESGTLYVRVAPGEEAVACEAYTVSIEAI